MRPQLSAGARGDPRSHQNGTPLRDRDHDRESNEPPPQPQQHAKTVGVQEGAEDRPRATIERGPNQEGEGDPPEPQHALPAHSMPEWEEGDSPSQEEMKGSPPKRRALSVHGMQGRGGGKP